MERIPFEPGWERVLAPEFEKQYMAGLRSFLKTELSAGKSIYPRGSEYFAAFRATPFNRVRVVILGQDPYYSPGQAHGLAFSVRPAVPVPSSLQNVFTEIQNDLSLPSSAFPHGHLARWAEIEGVLLLNAILTVEKGVPRAHQGRGWERFTDRAVAALSEERNNLIFLLWGSDAQAKGRGIDSSRHLVLSTSHPSGRSADRGFIGCRHFSKANDYLERHCLPPINWSLA